jgi:phosphoenolpyruvate---glycerone phosphotransferase subunit DhaL
MLQSTRRRSVGERDRGVIGITVMRAATVKSWIEESAVSVREESDHLTQLDSAIGDGDHGINMNRGFDAVTKALAGQDPSLPPGQLLILAGKTLVATVGGASGPLYGTAFRAAGRALGKDEEFDGAELLAALEASIAAVQDLGAAAPGDKTMIDALVPAVGAMRTELESGAAVPDAVAAAARAADEGARATVPMQARKGRASYLGERSIGHQDPGATSSALLIDALRLAVEREG